MFPAAAVVIAAPLLLAAAAGGEVLPGWIDTVSRVGVVGFLVLGYLGLHRKWWVPGWVHRDLQDRHDRLRGRYDAAIDIALNTSRGVERSATLLESALARAERQG